MRREGWEDRYLIELERHQNLPGEYGVSDCFRMPMDVAQTCIDRNLDYAFKYSNEQSAAKIMKQHKWKDMADVFAHYFREIPPAMAGRADIGVVIWDQHLCGVVVTGPDVVGKHPIKGLVRLPRSALVKAYRVE